MSYAMIGALLVALLLIPGLAYAIYRKPHKIYKNKWLDRLKDKYIRTITRFLEGSLKSHHSIRTDSDSGDRVECCRRKRLPSGAR